MFHEYEYSSRSSDSFSGDDCRGSLRLFPEKADWRQYTENIYRIRCRCHGAASVWSLLIPAMDMCEEMGKLAFLPAVVGFLIGIVFLLFIDSLVPHLHVGSETPEGHKSSLNRTAMLMLAVTIHNFPEGAACGAIFAGVLSGDGTVTMAGVLTLAIGIAIQNFPEGAIISLPLRSEGNKRSRSFALGVLSGAVEPVGAILAIALASM